VLGSVTELLASFRELRGIGPATETRLHEAGLYTWEALTDVLSALANVRGGVEGLRAELAELTAARDGAEPGADSERTEAFVLRLSVASGAVRRCSATHVRSQEEHSWPRWAPEELLGFVRDHAEPQGLPQVAPPDAEPLPPAVDAGSRHHVVVLDAGKAVGGGHRPVDLLVPTAALTDLGALDWTASVGGRAMGDNRDSSWVAPARLVGRVVPPDPVVLRFERVPLPGGLQRLWLRLELRLSAPVTGLPELVAQRAAAGV
jgi:hypothetical protein